MVLPRECELKAPLFLFVLILALFTFVVECDDTIDILGKKKKNRLNKKSSPVSDAPVAPIPVSDAPVAPIPVPVAPVAPIPVPVAPVPVAPVPVTPAAPTPSAPASTGRRGLVGETIFDVVANGAKPDGKTESALGFMKAWNGACQATGPAKVLVPPGTFTTGEIIFSGPCTSPQPIIIEIQGTVLSRTDLSLYSNNIWITIQGVEGVIVTGGGTLNGQGQDSWKFDNGGNGGGTLLPLTLVLEQVKNSVVQDIKLVDSKGFHMKITDSSNITVTNVNINAPGDSPNTDGVHISDSQDIFIINSVIGTGDDCVSIGDGNTHITVSNITCGPGHGISIGSLGKRPDETDVSGVTVTNCTLTGTTNGARIKTYHDSPTLQASGIIFEDLIMNEVANPIIIDQHYNSKKNPKQSNVKIVDVHFRNIRGTTSTPIAISLNCSDTTPCENIELSNIDLAPVGGAPALSAACSNAKPTVTGTLNPPACP